MELAVSFVLNFLIGYLALAAITMVWFLFEMHRAPLGEENAEGYGPINPRPRDSI